MENHKHSIWYLTWYPVEWTVLRNNLSHDNYSMYFALVTRCCKNECALPTCISNYNIKVTRPTFCFLYNFTKKCFQVACIRTLVFTKLAFVSNLIFWCPQYNPIFTKPISVTNASYLTLKFNTIQGDFKN